MTEGGGRRTRRHDRGMTLVELLLALLILMAIVTVGATMTFGAQATNSGETLDRHVDGAAAQQVSVRFGRDVEGASGTTTTACGTTGTRLLTLVDSTDAHLVSYRDQVAGGSHQLLRTVCNAAGVVRSESPVADELLHAPTVACTPSPCTGGSTPRTVTLTAERRSTFAFAVTSARRSTVSGTAAPATPVSVLALGGTTPLALNGNARLSVTGNLFVNSTGTAGITISGNNARIAATALGIKSGATCSGCSATAVSPYPASTLPVALPDPLAYLPTPSETGLATISCPGATCSYGGPGIYPKTLSISTTTAFAAGTYVLHQGLTVSGNNTITGTGVFLYNGCGLNVVGACTGTGGISISGQAAIALSAPTTGTYAGILVFQGRSNTAAFSISGGSNLMALTGTVYLPASTAVSLGAGNGGIKVSGLIGSNLSISGNGTVQVSGP